VDAIERSLVADDAVSVSPYFAHRVMAEVRAVAAMPPRPAFVWKWLLLKLATYLSLAVAALVVMTSIEPARMAPVGIYLMTAAAATMTALAVMRLRQMSGDGA
jgi:hypothetical protein